MGMLACIPLWANADEKLSGTVIGTLESVDYSNGQQSTTVNSREKAFDGNPNTFFASYERNYTWTGLDLGSPHIITKVGWMPRNDGLGPNCFKGHGIVLRRQSVFADPATLYHYRTRHHWRDVAG